MFALAIVVASYVGYALVVVPFVEPNIKLSKKSQSSQAPAARVRKLDHLFPPDAWELDRPFVVDVDQGTVLFAGYKPLDKNRLKLTKCTLIAYVDDSSDRGAEQEGNKPGRRPIIIRALQGATLQFDQALNVLRGEFGGLLGGLLDGDVTIQSPPSDPASDDMFELATKNVQVDQRKIWTPHPVRFRYGPNSGSGEVLTIHLANSGGSKGVDSGLGISGVRFLELDRMHRMELLLHNQGLFGGQKPTTVAALGQKVKSPATPVEVRCSGPLRFDFDRQLISLNDNVNLIRTHPGGMKDELTCQKLEIHFTESNSNSKIGTEPVRADGTDKKLTPTRVVATGKPVTIRAASVGIGARAERIEYDCVLQRVWLQDHDKVMLNDEQREVEARELRYTLGEGNRVGDLWAQGPGIVRGEFGQEMRPFQVTWKDQVQLQRVNDEPVLSFNQQAQVTVADLGSFAGDTVHLYLRETARGGEPDRIDTAPNRLHAIGHVEVDSETWHGSLSEAKVWFKPAESEDTIAATDHQPERNLFSAVAGPPETPRSKFDLQANIVEAIVFMRKKPVVDLLIVRGGLQLHEIASEDARPVSIRGDHFELQHGASDHPKAALLGSPAEIIARGMVARGSMIYLYPVDNSLKIVGAGEMKPPVAQESALPADATLPGNIEWEGSMQFDGQLARFEKNVTVRGTQTGRTGDRSNFVASGDVVHAELSQRVDFQNPKGAGKVELKEVAFDGWGFLQTEMFDAAGERKLFEQMQVLGLTVNHQTGELHGSGPGWLRGIHRGKDVMDTNPGTPMLPVRSESGLSFLRVDFEREMTGNLRQQRLEFLNGTKTLYGPVKTWDDSLDQDQSGLPPGAINLTCDRLAVAQFAEGGGDSVELEAVGNAHIQGDAFSATGGRVSYVRIKDQFILEGDGRNVARIEYQPQPGARPSYLAARKIEYWPKTGQCHVVDWLPSEFYNVGPQLGRGAPMIKPR